MTTNRVLSWFLAVGVVLAAGCGGGGGAAIPAPAAPLPASYWKMDTWVFANALATSSQAGSIAGQAATEVTAVSASSVEATAGQGTIAGSTLRLAFVAAAPGDYKAVADDAAFVASPIAQRPMVVTCQIGPGGASGSSLYGATANGAQVRVTAGSDGRLHYQTPEPLTMHKLQDTNGGATGAPQIMMLSIKDVY